jgi:heme-degrading monooxygenase HmoA
VYARLTTTVLAAGEPDTTGEVTESLLPTLRGLPGFKGVLIIASRRTQLIHAITLWESAEALEENEAVMNGLRDAETALREVVAQETGGYEVTAIHLPRL